MLRKDVADPPANPGSHPATAQPSLLGEITDCQEAIQQALMALRTGS
jgi:hypothetical protein